MMSTELLKRMALELDLSEDYLHKIANRSTKYYKVYTISKSKGGMRTIHQPSPELKTMQYWLVRNVISKFPVSDHAYAYRKGASIRKHADCHSKSNFIFHTDITQFFDNISMAHLTRLLKDNASCFNIKASELDDEIILISNICLFNGHATIGAVSSPAISNAVLYTLDTVMNSYCGRYNYTYTRYADDLYVSSDTYIDRVIVNDVSRMISSNNFEMNKIKTYFMSKKNRRMVTGLTITPHSKISIGLENKKIIKSKIYKFLLTGVGNNAEILGYLAFLQDVEPSYYDKIMIKYSAKGDIIKILRGAI